MKIQHPVITKSPLIDALDVVENSITLNLYEDTITSLHPLIVNTVNITGGLGSEIHIISGYSTVNVSSTISDTTVSVSTLSGLDIV